MGILGRIFGNKSPDDYSAELRRDAAVANPPRPARPSVTAPGSDAEVLALVAEGKKINAIKQYRESHGVGLKEAKEAVEALAAEHGL